MKKRHNVIPITNCLIINEKKILLIGFSKKKGVVENFFDCPGGHIESGEGVIENARREIFEETGLKVKDIEIRGVIHIKNFLGKNVMLFVTLSKVDTFDVIESDEGRLHWVSLDKINELNLMDDLKIIIEKTLEEKSFFTGKSEFDGGYNLLKIEFE